MIRTRKITVRGQTRIVAVQEPILDRPHLRQLSDTGLRQILRRYGTTPDPAWTRSQLIDELLSFRESDNNIDCT